MTCEHTHVQTWRLKDTGESAQLWSCVACAEKFLPITQAWAESRKRAEDMRERATQECLIGVRQRAGYDGPKNEEFDVRDSEAETCAEMIRALPVDPTLPNE